MPDVDVDVRAGDNTPRAMHRAFSALDDPSPITHVRGPQPEGGEGWLNVTGWSESGPCQAFAVPVEDPRDGHTLLVYGGNEGIRLKPDGVEEPWDIASLRQWGEPCLLLGVDTDMV